MSAPHYSGQRVTIIGEPYGGLLGKLAGYHTLTRVWDVVLDDGRMVAVGEKRIRAAATERQPIQRVLSEMAFRPGPAEGDVTGGGK